VFTTTQERFRAHERVGEEALSELRYLTVGSLGEVAEAIARL